MTFLHKLAKRLALIPAALIGTLSLLASCGERAHDYLGPDPSKPNPAGAYIGLSITPHDPQLVEGDSVRLEARAWLASGLSVTAAVNWTAQGGIVSGAGWFRPAGSGAFRVRAVSTTNPALSDSVLVTVVPQGGIARLDITPSAAPLAAGTRQQFTAVALMGDGSRMFPTVAWSATGGSISPSGLFTASGGAGSYTVTASIGDGMLLGETAGIVDPAVLTGLALDPEAAMLESGSLRQFIPYASWSDGANAVPALSWTATGGTITPSGVYTAGNTPGSYRVIASSVLGKADTANVTILPRIIGIRLSPLTAFLALEATQGLTAYARRNDGSESPVGVDWSANGGIISLDGTYSAGTTPGTYAIVGTLTTLSGQVFSDTANFQVGADEATAVQLFVTPDTTIRVGNKVQFIASSGGTTVPAVTWSATGGSIDSKGLYSAGSVPGNYRVIGKRKNQTKADTADVVVQPAPVLAVSGFTISPQSDIIGIGQTRQFSATLTWNDGAVHPANISWVSAGGTITQNGLYTAGTLAGTYLIIATCGCGAADTASVTIPAAAAPPVTLSKIDLTPPTVQLAPGGSQIFVATGQWSDGVTAAASVSYIATGGSISQSGVYIAGSTPGTYQVIAQQAGGSLADTSVVTVTQAPATLTQLVLNPSAVTVPSGATQAFVVSASWSDGSSTVPPVTFTATGGTVTPTGEYTAGTSAGSFKLIATHTGGTKADTSVITIPAAVTLTQVLLSPSVVSLPAAGTQQFVISGIWSDGSSVAPSVTYSATGGTISPTGLYTAGSTAGTFRVIAVQVGGTKADTSAITIAQSSPPPPTSVVMPELPRTYLNTTYQRPAGTTRRVAAGGDVQSALNAAQCGDRILLAAGATYIGAYILPNKNCSTWIEISTETSLPAEGVRATPSTVSGYAKLLSPGANQPTLVAAKGAGFYRIMGVEFGSVASATILGAIVELHADNMTTVAEIPHDIVFDRVIIRGHDLLGLRRCILLNAVRAAVIDSYLAGCHYKGSDAQAILFWDTPGPIKVVNNYLEGSGENLMIGGADPKLAGVVPSDIEIRGNHFFKPAAWKTSGAWTVKNLLELKLGKRVLIEGNIFENTWADGQVGYAMVLKSVNQSGTAPWSETSDITIRGNVIMNAGHGIDISAHPEPYPAVWLSRIAVVNNLMYKLGATSIFGGPSARGLMLDGSTANVTIANNTIVGSTGFALLLYGSKSGGTVSMRNNILESYIQSADGLGWGNFALNGHLTSWDVQGNGFVVSYSNVVAESPTGNQYVSALSGAGFVNLAGNDYSLTSWSALKGSAIGGGDPGADIAGVTAATAGVRVP